MISLTNEERRKFSFYLKQEAAAKDIIVEQMKKMAIPEMIFNREAFEAAAMRAVARIFDSTFTDTI